MKTITTAKILPRGVQKKCTIALEKGSVFDKYEGRFRRLTVTIPWGVMSNSLPVLRLFHLSKYAIECGGFFHRKITYSHSPADQEHPTLSLDFSKFSELPDIDDIDDTDEINDIDEILC